MTLNGICHHQWESLVIHVCGRKANHNSWHQCPCGAVLYTNVPPTEPEPPVVEHVLDDGEGLRYTFHANQRRIEMNVRHHEVRAALDAPELSYPADDRTKGGTCYQAGRIVVVTSGDGAIITLLWHGAEGRDNDGQALSANGTSVPSRKSRKNGDSHN